jgi:membrane-associated protease RseP (regulator of RpoE activity)
MSYSFGVIFFVVALLTSVMLHEAGHFVMAKKFGMKATRFFVGFGPTLWSTRRGETEYGVKAIPAGGFVKIVGMTQLEELEPGDEERAFYKQPAPQRLVVLAAGSIVHFILAIVLLFIVVATTGDPLNSRLTLTVDATAQCLPVDPNVTSCKGLPPAPAFKQLEAGDRIEKADGMPLASYEQLRTRIQQSAGRPIVLTVSRHGVLRDIALTPVPVKDATGHVVGRIGLEPLVVPAPVSVAGAVPKTFALLGSFTTSTVSALGKLPHEIGQILQGRPRSATGALGPVDIAKISGQIAQAKVSFGYRLANLVLIVAQLNFFVGIFNLLPLLPLDGGHVGIVVFEQARSRLYRLFRRRDPGRVDLMKVMPFTYAVVAVFVGLSLLLLYAGIANPVHLQ